jgi:hypothetical protein
MLELQEEEQGVEYTIIGYSHSKWLWASDKGIP